MGSLDSHILEERPNKFIDLLAATPSIRAVAFNGFQDEDVVSGSEPAYAFFAVGVAGVGQSEADLACDARLQHF